MDALLSCKCRWDISIEDIKRRDPFSYPFFCEALNMVDKYTNFLRRCGPRWIGLKFHFPLIWLMHINILFFYELEPQEEAKFWQVIECNVGYYITSEK
jgi:hypothetical protein